MDDETQTNPIIEEAQDVTYEFPKSEQITIHKSDLQIQLERFKDRIAASFSVFDLLAIVSLWSPVILALTFHIIS
jgi:hypothetical protein